MVEIKVSEATNTQLDWLVAEAQGLGGQRLLREGKWYDPLCEEFLDYSTNWAQGGPIIEREDIGFQKMEGEPLYQAWAKTCIEYASWPDDASYAEGPTQLIAAMRCYVASKLGAEVEVPEELTCTP